MKRIASTPRHDWQQKCEQVGFMSHSALSENGQPYWREDVQYEVGYDEVLQLERLTTEVFDLCMQAVEHIVRERRFEEFDIPELFWDEVVRSWDEDDVTVYGRFDISYREDGSSKLLEFNADTPTSLLEAAVVQWHWLKEVYGEDADQFNSIHEKLIEQWQYIREERWKLPHGALMHFSSLYSAREGVVQEDYDTVQYVMDTAQAAGFSPKYLPLERVQWQYAEKTFIDEIRQPIAQIFKLYPWEWMMREEYAPYLVEGSQNTKWVEPLWKALLSNKQLLVVLWELFPNHPHLLPASRSGGDITSEKIVRKPRLGREGADVMIFDAGSEPARDESVGYVYQAYYELPKYEHYHPCLGLWVVGDAPAGLGIRETSGVVTDDAAFFVPHRIC